MVLVDTSVWAKFYRNREPYAEGLARLIEVEEVAAHELIYGELLIGDPGGARNLLRTFQHIRFIDAVSHPLVVALVEDRKLHGRGIGWIDAHLLASALAGRVSLWTADAALRDLAEELGVAYRSA